MSKQDMRSELAALSFTEKVGILEKLRDRSLAFSLVRVSLVPGPQKGQRDQESFHELEAQAQKYLNSYLKSDTVGFRSALHEVLRSWVQSDGKVRLEVEVDGKARWKEITRSDELDNLLGPGRTQSDLLGALGRGSDGSCLKAE